MTDEKSLRAWIEAKGYKLKAIAAALGISTMALQNKIENRSEFKASEIAAFGELGMSATDRDRIFFGVNVD